MKNINELLELNYTLENIDNRIIRIRNFYGDVLCSVFVNSGACILADGKIFNHFTEVKAGIKKEGTIRFLNL